MYSNAVEVSCGRREFRADLSLLQRPCLVGISIRPGPSWDIDQGKSHDPRHRPYRCRYRDQQTARPVSSYRPSPRPNDRGILGIAAGALRQAAHLVGLGYHILVDGSLGGGSTVHLT